MPNTLLKIKKIICSGVGCFAFGLLVLWGHFASASASDNLVGEINLRIEKFEALVKSQKAEAKVNDRIKVLVGDLKLIYAKYSDPSVSASIFYYETLSILDYLNEEKFSLKNCDKLANGILVRIEPSAESKITKDSTKMLINILSAICGKEFYKDKMQ